MSLSLPHIFILLIVVLLLFGTRLPRVMGDLGKGMKAFKKGLNEEDETEIKKDDINTPKL